MTVRAFGYEPGKGNFPRPVFCVNENPATVAGFRGGFSR